MTFGSLQYEEMGLYRRINAQEIGSDGPAYLKAFLFFHISSSHVLLPILMATFVLSKYAKRPATLISVCVTWILSGIFSSMLLYVGHERGKEPEKNLCIAQASMLNGTPPMWSVAVLAFVYQVRNSLPGVSKPLSRWKLCALFVAPYVTLAIWSTACAILAMQHPDHVSRSRRYFYCSLWNDPFTNMMSLFTAIACLSAIALQVHIGVILSRNWRALRKAGHSSDVDLQLIIRLCIFELYIFIGMILDVTTIFTNGTVVPDMFAATIGFMVFIIFGLQGDVLRTWAFWRPPQQPRLPPVYLSREPSFQAKFDLAECDGAVKEDWTEKVMYIGRGDAGQRECIHVA
ncbi:hypothetical protein GLOTRDRAFT_111257 [Gloeophyllum trabeum ATCC 11539]|uniref:Uncharacterized protein n=1 Tax=Gloeophyllum trabeum (strain ATCC 11539 / FP-39264 / Madison 617) TaxID=670483 RepID=S7Q4M0_GLOTA|nr:uncharacterized protein GLOTRDRAFT_111257 [Gloeophyllum trabeum ATCC 11539]EPQ54428.1 hypothetical protein GLOTRDRAFT_111257 [Gloeophyllum trabeum ATCC 11539]